MPAYISEYVNKKLLQSRRINRYKKTFEKP